MDENIVVSGIPQIPDKGTPITAAQVLAIEQRVIEHLAGIHDVGELEEMRAKARALEHYLRSKELQKPMLGVQRRLEARIGQLLGDAVVGRPSDDNCNHDYNLIEHSKDRVDFRILARGLEIWPLDTEEWRKSRRALVSLVRNKVGLIPELEPLPEGIFRCVVADPPWQLDTGPDAWATTSEAGHDNLEYEQMSVERISRMPVEERLADDAHLYLWTTNRYLEASYSVARSWGFNPSVVLVWAKKPRGVGLGDAFRLTTEFVLYARRGKLKEKRICEKTWFNWPRGIHSEKPDGFFELVESMTPAQSGERLELFSRKPRKGWVVWGDEV